jgi:hypothetical protein
MLHEWLSPELQERSPYLISQQGRVQLHSHNEVTSYFDKRLSNRRIGRGGPEEWSQKSPDLPLIDIFL